MSDELGNRALEHPLRAFRIRHRLSLESVACAIGVSKASISRIETWRQTPTLGVIERLIAFCGTFDGEALTADSFLMRRRGRK